MRWVLSTQSEFHQHARIPSPLRLRRLILGMTQAELGKAAGVSREGVLNLEAERCRPRPATADRLAQALKCPADVLFPENDKRPAGKRAVVTTPAGGVGGDDSG